MQQQPQQQQQQPQANYVLVPVPAPLRTRPAYNHRRAKTCGILQVVFGCIAIVLQVISICLQAGMFYVGHGIWLGLVFVVAGGLTIPAAQYKSTCWIVASMVMSIIAALFGLTLFGTLWGDVVSDIYIDLEYNRGGLIFMHIILGLVGFCEMVTAITTSVLACMAVCCGQNQTHEEVAYAIQSPAGAAGAGVSQEGSTLIVGPGASAPQQGSAVVYVVPKGAATHNTHAISGPSNTKSEPPPAYNTLESLNTDVSSTQDKEPAMSEKL